MKKRKGNGESRFPATILVPHQRLSPKNAPVAKAPERLIIEWPRIKRLLAALFVVLLLALISGLNR